MAGRKRITVSRLTLFKRLRAKRLRVNLDVPAAIERFCGRSVLHTWMRLKLAVWIPTRKLRGGRHV